MRLCILLLVAAGAIAAADRPVRYRFGDDPGWAAPDYDDSGWTASAKGQWPNPTTSDGMAWIRWRAPVPNVPDPGGFAVRIGPYKMPLELWVNGRLLGGHGSFPPHSAFAIRPERTA